MNAFLFAFINIAFISAIHGTSVANTGLFLSSVPVFAALLSLTILKESQRPTRWLIIALYLISNFIIDWVRYGSPGLTGNMFALRKHRR